MRYDVIVVGAGPAGCMAAHDLAAGGARVLVLEESEADGAGPESAVLTRRAQAVLPFDLGQVAQREIRRVLFTFRERDPIEVEAGLPIADHVNRRGFSALLAERARAAGADLIGGVRVCGTVPGGEGIRALTNRGIAGTTPASCPWTSRAPSDGSGAARPPSSSGWSRGGSPGSSPASTGSPSA